MQRPIRVSRVEQGGQTRGGQGNRQSVHGEGTTASAWVTRIVTCPHDGQGFVIWSVLMEGVGEATTRSPSGRRQRTLHEWNKDEDEEEGAAAALGKSLRIPHELGTNKCTRGQQGLMRVWDFLPPNYNGASMGRCGTQSPPSQLLCRWPGTEYLWALCECTAYSK